MLPELRRCSACQHLQSGSLCPVSVWGIRSDNTLSVLIPRILMEESYIIKNGKFSKSENGNGLIPKCLEHPSSVELAWIWQSSLLKVWQVSYQKDSRSIWIFWRLEFVLPIFVGLCSICRLFSRVLILLVLSCSNLGRSSQEGEGEGGRRRDQRNWLSLEESYYIPPEFLYCST